MGFKRKLVVCNHSIRYCQLLFTFSFVLLSCTAGPATISNEVGDRGSRLESATGKMSNDGGYRRRLETNSPSAPGTVPLVIAEGGAQYLYPEMTMRAYEEAMNNGADFLVCMVAMTSDQKAICHPDFDLTRWTDILKYKKFEERRFKFNQMLNFFSFNFTLAEIQQLKVNQTKPLGRTKAFNSLFPVATPEEVIAAIGARAAMHPSAKRVGIILEMNTGTADMSSRGISLNPVSYAIELLLQNNWTTPDAPAMVISQTQADLKMFAENGIRVHRLLRVPLNGQNGDVDLSAKFRTIAEDATGVMLHVGSILTVRKELFWGRFIERVYWANETMVAARAANLSVFPWGFEEADWSSAGPRFNTFQSDPVTMYRSLLYGEVGHLVAGVATDWPATAAKAAACYGKPVDDMDSMGLGSFFPTKGLAKDRPLIIASGGSVGLLPAHTNLSYLQAIKEGADFIDCTLQVSRDEVLFCLESMQLSRYTDVLTGNLKDRKALHTPIVDQGRIPDVWAFDLLWSEIQTLRVVPKTRNNNAIRDPRRLTDFYKTLPPLLFDNLISIAQNAPRVVGLLVKIDYPTFLQGLGTFDKPAKPIDQIALMLATLRRRGYLRSDNIYNPESAPPLLVASGDSCGLARMRDLSKGTLRLVKRTLFPDTCEFVTKNATNTSDWWQKGPGLDFVKTIASGISPSKMDILKIHNITGTLVDGLITSTSNLASEVKVKDLRLYPRVFRNDVDPGDREGAYDFLSDPAVELEYYLDQLKVDAVDVQFVSTAIQYLQSSCRPRPGFVPTDPGFNATVLRPGAIAAEIEELTKPSPRKGSGVKAKTVGGIAAGVFVIAAALAVAAVLAKWRRKKEAALDDEEQMRATSFASFPTLRMFTQAELVTATNNFSEANRLGTGAFGAVFHGVVEGRDVAIKKLHLDLKRRTPNRSSDPVRQLLNEVQIIGTVHNRNVVPLEGLCIDKELLLVYEHMPNGSLQDAIFNPDYPTDLSWRQWYNIVVGTAKGLAYLHEECEHKIIHRDIKPANILLDAQHNARVADFGLARNVEVNQTHVTTKVMGSIGFMAPDYATTGQLTERSDVYSFGILLVTILTGRLPIHFEGDKTITVERSEEPGEEPVTLEMVKKKAQEGTAELLTVIHPKFAGKYDEEEAIRWLHVALLCAQHVPSLRPSMGDVVQMLQGRKEVPEITVTPATIFFPEYLQSKRWAPGPSQSVSTRKSSASGFLSPTIDTSGSGQNDRVD